MSSERRDIFGYRRHNAPVWHRFLSLKRSVPSCVKYLVFLHDATFSPRKAIVMIIMRENTQVRHGNTTESTLNT